jgi:8-oxo-dGTP pyrophosphatase MutT (NUDIX family)
VRAAARREAVEEGGIADLRPVADVPLDLDRHDLGPGFARCDTHWDVGYGFLAPATSAPVVSAESDAVRWWPVDALPSAVPPGFAARLRRAVAAVGSTSGG